MADNFRGFGDTDKAYFTTQKGQYHNQLIRNWHRIEHNSAPSLYNIHFEQEVRSVSPIGFPNHRVKV